MAEFIKKAEKEKNRWFVSEEQKASNAAGYYEQGGNVFKSRKLYKEAADCFVKAATLKIKIGRGYDAAGLFKAAGIQLKLVGDPTSTAMLNRAVDLYSELGKGQMAAKLSKELGEASEKAQEFEDALIHFERASDLFKGEGSDTHARQCMEKVAIFHAQMSPPDYGKAATIFEELGVDSLSSRLGRFNARKFFFRAILCVMANGDVIGARAKHGEFKETDYQFGSSREGKFLDKLITALEAYSGENFSEAYRDYVDISPLDPWHTSVLRQAQKTILGEEEEKPKKSNPKPKPSPSFGGGRAAGGAYAGGGGATAPAPPAASGDGQTGEVVPAVPAGADDEETDEDNDPFA